MNLIINLVQPPTDEITVTTQVTLLVSLVSIYVIQNLLIRKRFELLFFGTIASTLVPIMSKITFPHYLYFFSGINLVFVLLYLVKISLATKSETYKMLINDISKRPLSIEVYKELKENRHFVSKNTIINLYSSLSVLESNREDYLENFTSELLSDYNGQSLDSEEFREYLLKLLSIKSTFNLDQILQYIEKYSSKESKRLRTFAFYGALSKELLMKDRIKLYRFIDSYKKETHPFLPYFLDFLKEVEERNLIRKHYEEYKEFGFLLLIVDKIQKKEELGTNLIRRCLSIEDTIFSLSDIHQIASYLLHQHEGVLLMTPPFFLSSIYLLSKQEVNELLLSKSPRCQEFIRQVVQRDFLEDSFTKEILERNPLIKEKIEIIVNKVILEMNNKKESI